MHSNTNTLSDQVKSFKQVFAKLSTKTSKNLYNWADKLFFDHKIPDAVLHTLKAIISCNGLDRPTIKQINNARTNSAALKFAQSNAVTERTVRRHIEVLEELDLIGVERSRDERRNSRNAYTIKAPAPELSCPSEDIVTPSLTLATSSNYNNTKSNLPKENKGDKLSIVFDKEQLAILSILLSWKTWKGAAVRWLNEFNTQELQEAIKYVESKNRRDKGAYMHIVIRNLDERKRAMKQEGTKRRDATMDNEPAEVRAAKARRIEQEAVRRLIARHITDPRTGGMPDYEACRKYDVLLNDEIRKIYTETAHTYAKN